MAAWVNPVSFANWNAFASFSQDNGADENGWSFGLMKDKRFFFGIAGKTNSRTNYLYSTKYGNLNQWAHLVASYDGSKMKLYLDGVETNSSSAVSGDIKYNDSWFVLG